MRRRGLSVTFPSSPLSPPWIECIPERASSSFVVYGIAPSLAAINGTHQAELPACRYVPMFGETEFDVERVYASAPLEEQLEALGRAVEAGKVCQVGLSNETPWGLMECCRLGAQPALHCSPFCRSMYALCATSQQCSKGLRWNVAECYEASSSVNSLQQRRRRRYRILPRFRTPTGTAHTL